MREYLAISLLAKENLAKIELVEYEPPHNGAPAPEIIYQDEEVIIAWPPRLVKRHAWEYTIDPVPPGMRYKEYRSLILFLFAKGKTDVLAVVSVPQRKDLFPSQLSWLETMAWLAGKAGFSGTNPKRLGGDRVVQNADLD
jgi:hypothetical protein